MDFNINIDFTEYLKIIFFWLLLLFLIGLLFWGKLRFIRYCFWTVAVLFLLWSFSAYFKEWLEIKKQKKRLVGVFVLSDQSNLCSPDSSSCSYNYSNYKNLTLTVRPDYTLSIQPDSVSFLKFTKGTLTFGRMGRETVISLELGKDLSVRMGFKNDLELVNPQPKARKQQVSSLAFIRKEK